MISRATTAILGMGKRFRRGSAQLRAVPCTFLDGLPHGVAILLGSTVLAAMTAEDARRIADAIHDALDGPRPRSDSDGVEFWSAQAKPQRRAENGSQYS